MLNKNKSKGFLQYIIIIVIAVFLMSYFNITFREFVDWFITAIKSIFS